MRKRWLWIMAIIIIAGVSYTAFLLFGHNEGGSLTVSELRSQAESPPSQQLRVEGKIRPGSIDWDDKGQVMRFVLTDDNESVRMVYEGMVPDNFKPGDDLVVDGKYRPDGVFEASNFGEGNSFCGFCH